MNERVKKLWVEALRSGEYRQGVGMLRDKHGRYCCLGVLCDLHAKDTGGGWGKKSDVFCVPPQDSYLWCTGKLPHEVARWAGIMEFGQVRGQDDLVSKNDNGATFSDIALIIEQDLLEDYVPSEYGDDEEEDEVE